ncbi:unnamed protein product [Amoebophrya sp. A25]|nr:unnamed protein product [Amoebophrya sp. A25]|eukprot:GSA25T00012799001.1
MVNPSAAGQKRTRDDMFVNGGGQVVSQPLRSLYCLTWRRSEREWLENSLRGVLGVLRRAKNCNLQHFGGEAAIFEGLLILVERSLDVLHFLQMLSESLPHILMPPMMNSPSSSSSIVSDAAALSRLAFRDLVHGEQGRATVSRFVKNCSYALNCARLAQKCPHLLSIAEAEIQHAHELLDRMHQGTSLLSNAPHAVETAVSLLKRNLALVDMQETGARLRLHGCIVPLIELAALKAKELDPADTASEVPAQGEAVFSARMKIYDIVYHSLNDLALRAEGQIQISSRNSSLSSKKHQQSKSFLSQQPIPEPQVVHHQSSLQLVQRHQHQQYGGSSGVPMIIRGDLNNIQAAEVLERLIWTILEVPDRLFQCGLFKLLLTWKAPIWELQSPYLADFLLSRRSIQPELLCKWYQANGQWLAACEEYRNVARLPWPANGDPDNAAMLALEERLNFLETASHISGDYPDVRASLLFLIRQVRCQMTALSELEEVGANPAILRDVQASILDVPVLQSLADKYSLHTTNVAICFWHEDTRNLRAYVDRWMRYTTGALNNQRNPLVLGADAVRDRVVRLLLAYLKPFSASNNGVSAIFLPLDLIALRLFEYASGSGGSTGGSPGSSVQQISRFVAGAFREAGIAWPEVYGAISSAGIPAGRALYELKHDILLSWEDELSHRNTVGTRMVVQQLQRCFAELAMEMRQSPNLPNNLWDKMNHLSLRVERLALGASAQNLRGGGFGGAAGGLGRSFVL